MRYESTLLLTALERAVSALYPEARVRLSDFLNSAHAPGGGYCGRVDLADPYYASFAYALAFALKVPLDAAAELRWLRATDHSLLDLAHATARLRAAALLRLMALRKPSLPGREETVRQLIGRGWRNAILRYVLLWGVRREAGVLLPRYRSQDGGFHHGLPGQTFGSAYGGFLAILIHRETGLPLSGKEALLRSLDSLRSLDGSCRNERSESAPLVTAAAARLAGISLLIGARAGEEASVAWLLRAASPLGGFGVSPGAEAPDLLSTATALLALHLAGEDLTPFAASTRYLIDLHWKEDGGFFGSLTDPVSDVEYTWYALLSLGLLEMNCG